MANRPLFQPMIHGIPSVKEINVDFQWFPGMSISQKQKSIASLHNAARMQGIEPILEISSKSEIDLGKQLSAFNLCITTKVQKKIFSVETAFQSSKVFDGGGPYIDLLDGTSMDAKRDARLKESGNLIQFRFFNQTFPTKPKTFFYDWLYINALNQNSRLANDLIQYSGFTDIEFNPKKSLNCQAYSAALYVSLVRNGMLDQALKSPDDFLATLKPEYSRRDSTLIVQGKLL